ncbi:MAG: hypothetical protein AAB919_01225 [Patescibacteria group bacterium]
MQWFMQYLREVARIYREAYRRETARLPFGTFTIIAAKNTPIMYVAPITPLARYLERRLFPANA